MKFDKVALFCLLILFLFACSESDKVAGGSIEDQNADIDGVSSNSTIIDADTLKPTENKSSSSAASVIVPTDYKISYVARVMKFATESSDKIDYGYASVSTYKAENGASGGCSSDNQIFEGATKIMGDTIATVFRGKNLEDNLEPFIETVQGGCIAAGGTILVDTLIVEGTGFEYACLVTTSFTEINGKSLKYLGDVLSQSCYDMNASYGHYETLSSSSESDGENSFEDIGAPEICENCGTTNNQKISIDSSRTLENYVLQYVPNAEQLSFDNRVVAYNGTASMACMDYAYAKTGVSPTDMVRKSPLFQINQDDVSVCFPMTSKIMKEHPAKNKESCRYFMTMVDDGGQPMGHVLTSISEETLEFTSVIPGGECVRYNTIFPVYFLIEDCDGSIGSTEPESIRKPLSSEIWKCEDGSYSPSTNAISYGEWFKSSLL